MNCSDLKGHLYNLKLINDSKCECGYKNEDPLHFFFICPLYQRPRAALHNALSPLAPFTLQTLLFGRENLDDEQNKLIYRYTLDFIEQTERFE